MLGSIEILVAVIAWEQPKQQAEQDSFDIVVAYKYNRCIQFDEGYIDEFHMCHLF